MQSSGQPSLAVEGAADAGQQLLVGQLQPRVQGVLAHDQAVLVGHYHPAETDLALLALVDPLALPPVLLLEGVAVVQPEVHLGQALVDALPLQDCPELLLALLDEAPDELGVPADAPGWQDGYLM